MNSVHPRVGEKSKISIMCGRENESESGGNKDGGGCIFKGEGKIISEMLSLK